MYLERRMNSLRSIAVVLAVVWASAWPLSAETGTEGWLRYAPVARDTAARYDEMPNAVISLGNSDVLNSAKGELVRGIASMLGKRVREAKNISAENAFVLGMLKDVRGHFHEVEPSRLLGADGFWMRTIRHGGKKYWLIIGGSDRGVLYGTFAFLSRIAQGHSVDDLDDFEIPSAPIRWASQWDNLDGIERGYAGRSIFFDNGAARGDLTRAGEYARLLASVGINACAINTYYEPNIESAERNGWGQWIRADAQGAGMDRTVATGTGYIGQYSPEVQQKYETLAACPDELLLFMHHVPYSYLLHSGKTVIQHIYDSHYDGAEKAAGLVGQWESLRGEVDSQRYAEVLRKLEG